MKTPSNLLVLIRGKRWRLLFTRELSHQHLGECDHPSTRNKAIRIRKSLRGELRLDTLIHETLHAGYPDMSEDAINQVASDVARVLWKVGYRNIYENPAWAISQ